MRQLKITKSITNRESASLDKYLQEIGREELISVQEEVELAQRIRRGDQKALDKLTRANLRFVVSVAKQYQNQGLSLPDLINEGNLGLIRAAQKFDETRGFKFISYAVWWIRQSILQALAEQSRIVRLPLNQVGSLNKINKERSRFEQEYERLPSAEELADRLELAPEKVFFGGEKSVYSQVGGGDLFWGFKHNWRHYFSFMHDLHSGVVNDYALWAVVALALATLFMQIAL